VAPKGHGETILPVDDESNILEVASSLLVRANYRVITASTGKDALKIYAERRENIRLVILDVIMPGMSGEECLRAVLELDPDVKVLVASGALKPGMATDMKETGARDFVGKPFDMPQLLEKIRKIIDEE
jgi:two-component system, cell cycle sensor histidine kinase and response regulator CckA